MSQTHSPRPEQDQKVAAIESPSTSDDESRFFAPTPYLPGTLKSVLRLLREEELPDNGALSGAVISGRFVPQTK